MLIKDIPRDSTTWILLENIALDNGHILDLFLTDDESCLELTADQLIVKLQE